MEMEKALSLIDDLTPYYRHKITALPVQQRRVACTLARNGPCPMNSTLIARESRLEARAASTALTRLKEKGLVLHTNRTWTLADPWLGAWYRIRRGDTTKIPDDPPPAEPSLMDKLLLATGENIANRP